MDQAVCFLGDSIGKGVIYDLCQDGIHPNEQGHNLIADAAIKALQTT